MTEEYFCKLDLQFPFMDQIYYELNNSTWHISRHNQCRSDASVELKKLIKQFIPFTVNDCGFHKNKPGWKYPIHKDALRLAAINILLVDQCDDFKVNFYSDNFDKKIPVPYVRNELLLINTKKFHSVFNASLDKVRYVMTIGCVNERYVEIKKKFEQLSI
jgi:hypothetical protein